MEKDIRIKIKEKQMQISQLRAMIAENEAIIARGESLIDEYETIQVQNTETGEIVDVQRKTGRKIDANDVIRRTAMNPRLEEQITICEAEIEELERQLPIIPEN